MWPLSDVENLERTNWLKLCSLPDVLVKIVSVSLVFPD